MTLLISGSMLLIAGSALALLFGWVTANEVLIWISILSSAGAGALLALGYWQSRGELARARLTPPAAGPSAEAESEPPTEVIASRAAGRETQPMEAAEAPTGSSATIEELVVAIPDRKKFHRADCRFAGAKGAEKVSRETARRRGYSACGICRP